MDNQHRKIKGYRELKNKPDADKRWIAIGKTDLQTGLMALTRSIAKPEFF